MENKTILIDFGEHLHTHSVLGKFTQNGTAYELTQAKQFIMFTIQDLPQLINGLISEYKRSLENG